MKRILFWLFLFGSVFAQTNEPITFKVDKVANSIANSTTFDPQASTIFSFLGLTPGAIQRPAVIRDLKFDAGMMASGKISLGLEIQPIWLVGFRNTSYQTYSKIPGFVRNLLNMSVSVGLKQDTAMNSIGYAVRIPLYFKDPMSDAKYIEKLSFPMEEAEATLMEEIQSIDVRLLIGAVSPSERIKLTAQRSELNNRLEHGDAAAIGQAMAYKDAWVASNWNSAQINIYFANGFDVSSLDPITLHKQYVCSWISANQPVTAKGIVSELAKVYYESGTVTNLYFEYGANLTLGTPKANFFVEAMIRSTTNEVLNNFGFNFGGWFKPTPKLSFDLGLKFVFDGKANLIRLSPAVNASFKM